MQGWLIGLIVCSVVFICMCCVASCLTVKIKRKRSGLLRKPGIRSSQVEEELQVGGTQDQSPEQQEPRQILIEYLPNRRLYLMNQALVHDERSEEPPPSFDETFVSPPSKTSQSVPLPVGGRQEDFFPVDDQEDDQSRGPLSQRVGQLVAKQFSDPFLYPLQRRITEIRSDQSPSTALRSDISPSAVLQSAPPSPRGTYESVSKPEHAMLEMIEETPSLQGGPAPLNETDTREVESAEDGLLTISNSDGSKENELKYKLASESYTLSGEHRSDQPPSTALHSDITTSTVLLSAPPSHGGQ